MRVVQELGARVEESHRSSGRRVSLASCSLGGLYAQELTRAAPGSVRGIVTLGSPEMESTPWQRSAWDYSTALVVRHAESRPCLDPGLSVAPFACPRRPSTAGPTVSLLGRRGESNSGLGARRSRGSAGLKVAGFINPRSDKCGWRSPPERSSTYFARESQHTPSASLWSGAGAPGAASGW
jgi:pimeloyl-ACP methyl ester carboxylesterase